jgi:hypothetical protein
LHAQSARSSPQQPFGLEQRVQLSQLSQHAAAMDLLQNDSSEDFPSNNNSYSDIDETSMDVLHNDVRDESPSNTDCYGDSDSGCEMDDEDETLQREEVTRTLSQQGGSYNLLSAKVDFMYNNVVTVAQGLYALNAMDKLNGELMRMSFAPQGTSAMTGTVSLPTTNKRTSKHIRLRKASSPPRKKRAVHTATI